MKGKQKIKASIYRGRKLGKWCSHNKDFTINDMLDLAISKTSKTIFEEHTKHMEHLKDTERLELDELPIEVAMKIQSGFLLGFASCWNRMNDFDKSERNKWCD